MDFEEALEMSKDPDNIPGIYNYCDGWCDRCTFTSHCYNFKMRGRFEEEIEREEREKENQEFWGQVNESIEDVKDLLGEEEEKVPEESFFDFDDDDVEDTMKEYEGHRKKAKAQPIGIAGKRYMNWVTEWFEQLKDEITVIDPKDRNLPFRLEIPGIDDPIVLRKLAIALEIILYYHMQIWVKVNRSLTSSYDDFENDPEYKDMPKDSEGSAKVALLGIDQSIGGWATFLKYMPSGHEQFQENLTLLNQLRNAIERQFPNARNFKRPGFDD